MRKKIWGWLVERKEVFILLGLLVVFYNVNLGRQVLGIDDILGAYPIESILQNSGEPIRWLPHIYGGVPVMEMPIPVHVALTWVAPMHLVKTLQYFVYFLLAGVGMFVWARRTFPKHVALFGAMGWMMAPIMVSLIYAGHDGKIGIMAHLPWLLWAIDRIVEKVDWKRWLGLFIVFLSAFSVWHFQMMAYASLFVLIYGIFKIWGKPNKWRILLFSLLAFLAALIVLSPAIVRFHGLIKSSGRGEGIGMAHPWNLPIQEVPGMVNPGAEDPEHYTGYRAGKIHSEYMGLIIFLLGLLGVIWAKKRRWVYLLIGAVALLVALGFPPIKMVRSASMALFGLTFCWVTLAMYGIARMRRGAVLILSLVLYFDLARIDLIYIRPVMKLPICSRAETEYRIFDRTGLGNWPVLFGNQLANGNYPLPLKTYKEFMGGRGILPDFSNLDKHPNYARAANIRYVVIGGEKGPSVISLPALPKAYMVGKYRVIPGNCVDSIPKIDVDNEVILSEHPGLLSLSPGTAKIKEYKFNSATVETESEKGGILVFCDNYYPNWRAFVDGTRVRIIRANHTFRAVAVPAGKHTVYFKYFDSVR